MAVDFHAIQQVDESSFWAAAGQASLIFLEPAAHYRPVFIQHFVHQQSGLVYVTGANMDTAAAWVRDASVQIERVQPGFGASMRTTPAHDDPRAWATAFARDLQAGFGEKVIVFVDAPLNAPLTTDFAAFVTALPAHIHCILPQHMMYQPEGAAHLQAGSAAVISHRHTRDGWRFVPQPKPRPYLRAHTLGAISFFLDERPALWDTPLLCELAVFLCDHPMTTRDDVFAALWPTMDHKEATDVFHATKYRMNDLLGRSIGRQQDLTDYQHGIYMLNDELICAYDAGEMDRLCGHARQSDHPLERELLLRCAVGLYQGDFMDGQTADWIVRRRADLRHAQGEALIALAFLYEQAGDTPQAIALLERAVPLRPERDDACHRLIALYVMAGDVSGAQALAARLYSQVYAGLGLSLPAAVQALLSR